MAVGEPRHAVPAFVGPALAGALEGFGRYPAIRSTDAFRAAVAGWLDRRYGLGGAVDPASMILPLNGSREGLFYGAIEARMASAKQPARPAILIPNPFYQAYAAGAVAAGCEPVMVAATAETGFLPDPSALDPALLDIARWRCAFRLARQSAGRRRLPRRLVSADRTGAAVRLHALRRRVLFRDLWCGAAARRAGGRRGARARLRPCGELQLAVEALDLPGLRCGFAAGDPAFLTRWTVFRNMAAPQVPGPLQAVAVEAYGDEAHVVENRRLYNEKYAAAERILGNHFGPVTPPGGFFLWLDVREAEGGGAADAGEALALRLWREAGVRAVPGGYLATEGADGVNPGAGFLRLAMVDDLATTEEGLRRIVDILDSPLGADEDGRHAVIAFRSRFHGDGHRCRLVLARYVGGIAGLALIGLTAAVAVALASWSVTDPSYSYATQAAPKISSGTPVPSSPIWRCSWSASPRSWRCCRHSASAGG